MFPNAARAHGWRRYSTILRFSATGNVTLDGGLGDWTAADRIDISLGAAGYEIYGRVTGENYVIALKAPFAIGANTTAWLNTDRNAADDRGDR